MTTKVLLLIPLLQLLGGGQALPQAFQRVPFQPVPLAVPTAPSGGFLVTDVMLRPRRQFIVVQGQVMRQPSVLDASRRVATNGFVNRRVPVSSQPTLSGSNVLGNTRRSQQGGFVPISSNPVNGQHSGPFLKDGEDQFLPKSAQQPTQQGSVVQPTPVNSRQGSVQQSDSAQQGGSVQQGDSVHQGVPSSQGDAVHRNGGVQQGGSVQQNGAAVGGSSPASSVAQQNGGVNQPSSDPTQADHVPKGQPEQQGGLLRPVQSQSQPQPPAAAPHATQPLPATPQRQRDPLCFKLPDPGECRAAFPRYYYNPRTSQCDCFLYGGCGHEGLQSSYRTLAECQQRCVPDNTAEGPSCDDVFRKQQQYFTFPVTPPSAKHTPGTVEGVPFPNTDHFNDQQLANLFLKRKDDESIESRTSRRAWRNP